MSIVRLAGRLQGLLQRSELLLAVGNLFLGFDVQWPAFVHLGLKLAYLLVYFGQVSGYLSGIFLLFAKDFVGGFFSLLDCLHILLTYLQISCELSDIPLHVEESKQLILNLFLVLWESKVITKGIGL